MNLCELRENIAKYNIREINNKKAYESSGTYPLGDRQFVNNLPRSVNHIPLPQGKKNDIVVWRHSRYERHIFHTHDFIEIMFMYIGCGENITESETISLSEGDICIITPGAMHLPYIQGDSVLLNFLIKPPYFRELTQKLKSDGEIATYLKSIFENVHYKYLHIRNSEDKAAVELTSQLLLSFFEPEWADTAFEQKCRLELLLLYLIKNCNSLAHHSNKYFVCGNLFEKIHKEISAEYRQITLDDLSEKLGYSKAHICRVIKAASGTTFSDYVNRIKITDACRMLKLSELAISEISIACGFSNIEYFYRIFKRQMSVTPSEYRSQSK